MKRVLPALLAAIPLAADFDAARWKFRQPVSVTPGPGLASVEAGKDVLTGASPGLGDLRVTRDGKEIPYLIQTLAGSSEQKPQSLEILDQSVSPGSGLQLVLDFGARARHNRVRVQTGRDNFRAAVRVESSDDRRSWSLARSGAFLFDFTQDNVHYESLEIAYPLSTRRYLRLSIPGWNDPKFITGAQAFETVSTPPKLMTLGSCAPPPQPEPAARATLHACDLGAAAPVEKVRFEIGAQSLARGFHRAVLLESSPDAVKWTFAGSGVLSRLADETSLTVNVQGVARHWRARVFHRDDQPLPVTAMHFETVVREIRFERESPGEYALYYGNPAAQAPAYDLPVLLRGIAPQVTPAPLGARELNPAYREPEKPISERNPWLLQGILIAAVLILGFVTVRFLRKAQQGGPPAA
ncbi:MAG: DUF3999 domain-containing protein [Bryobacteraceae bacterium]|nr:DUF3999 domain-containing protein [Bryobacteraceae bacterium]